MRILVNGVWRWRTRVRALAVLALLALAGGAEAQSGLLDFVSFDGIHYLRWPDEPGRALTRDDLGIEFATIECSIGEDRRACEFGQDAAAAFMPTGTKMYAVRGYRTEFRLAAVWNERVFLYQAWRSARAKVGGDLFDIAGKVSAVDVQRGEPGRAGRGRVVRVSAADEVNALVRLVVEAEVRAPRPQAFGAPRYWLTFRLRDGTTLGRPYFPETGEILGGIVVPPTFQDLLERYLGN